MIVLILLVMHGFFVLAETVKGCFVIPFGVCFAFEAELAVTFHAIDYTSTFGWCHLLLESDSGFFGWSSFVLGLIMFFGVGARLGIYVWVCSLKWTLLSLIFT